MDGQICERGKEESHFVEILGMKIVRIAFVIRNMEGNLKIHFEISSRNSLYEKGISVRVGQ